MIELLAVIAILATLAALVIGGAGRAGAARLRARANADLVKLETNIESYKSDMHFYPPQGKTADLPPLYYELVGTRFDGTKYTPLSGDASDAVSKADVEAVFGIKGFANSDSESAKSHIIDLVPKNHTAITHASASNVRMLILPIDGPALPETKSSSGVVVNTWRYVSKGATNNPQSYDLWADIIVRKEVVRVGNFKE